MGGMWEIRVGMQEIGGNVGIIVGMRGIGGGNDEKNKIEGNESFYKNIALTFWYEKQLKKLI